jgi:GNAT superfamily N-acetyltransferase
MSPTTMTEPTIRRLPAPTEDEIAGLAAVLIDCVEGGASVGFMPPMTREKALAFWRRVASDVARGARALFVAELDGRVVGTVQLVLEQPENQPHRADVSKMLVASAARRRGLGARLMRAAEAAAVEAGRSVLVLDTCEGTSADRLYTRLGWLRVGVVPRYALNPDGSWCDTVVFHRQFS